MAIAQERLLLEDLVMEHYMDSMGIVPSEGQKQIKLGSDVNDNGSKEVLNRMTAMIRTEDF